MLKENQIFIHVPKTGGTTLNCALHGTDIPQNADFNFRHIIYETKMSNCGDIFNPLKNDKYKAYQIFMMLRHPIDRILSEYYFIKERDEFFSLLKPIPKTFEEYALHPQTANYVVSFLLGNKMYNKKRPDKEDLELVCNAIQSLDLTIGIYEKFEDSLALFQNKVGIDWPKTIDNKRVTIIRPKKEEIGKTLSEKIIARHHLDYELYEFALERFQQEKAFGKLSSTIKNNRYDYVLTYTNNHFLLELVLKGHPFIAQQKDYFNEVQKYLADLKLDNGEAYLKRWTDSFVAAMLENSLDADFVKFLEEGKNEHPIDFIQKLGKYVLSMNQKQLKGIHLEFKISQIKKPSLLSKLLSAFVNTK